MVSDFVIPGTDISFPLLVADDQEPVNFKRTEVRNRFRLWYCNDCLVAFNHYIISIDEGRRSDGCR